MKSSELRLTKIYVQELINSLKRINQSVNRANELFIDYT